MPDISIFVFVCQQISFKDKQGINVANFRTGTELSCYYK